MSSNSARLKKEFPLHWFVWHNEYKDLERELQKNEFDIEKKDPRGRTPLMLAVTLGHMESTKVCLRYKADVLVENKDGFTVVHEAISTGDPELLQEVMERRDCQRCAVKSGGIPELLKKIRSSPDFYVEMKWEFASWVPLVSRMCPSDTYKVYKSGPNVRVDTTLLGFDHVNWQRGRRSFIFKGMDDGAVVMEVDHDSGHVVSEEMTLLSPDVADMSGVLRPSEKYVSARLTNPITNTYIDTDKISFERSKAGLWGWRSDRNEEVNTYDCKVFSASNVELVTKTRLEHLTEEDKAKFKASKSPLQSLLGVTEMEEKAEVLNLINGEVHDVKYNPCNISPEEYFDETVELGLRDIGRPREQVTKVRKFKATLWLSEDYPLSLPEQILPIVDIMAINNTHFAKLRDFITLQLPAGFPVKIEIPLFHVLNARITFGNIFSLNESVTGVTCIQEDGVVSCIVDESCFDPPPHYTRLGGDEVRQYRMDDEDELLQYAIQQSLLEAGSEEDQVTVWEALRAERPIELNDEENALQCAIQNSMGANNMNPADGSQFNNVRRDDYQFDLAIKLSQQEQEEIEKRQREEEEMLSRVLQLSLTEK